MSGSDGLGPAPWTHLGELTQLVSVAGGVEAHGPGGTLRIAFLDGGVIRIQHVLPGETSAGTSHAVVDHRPIDAVPEVVESREGWIVGGGPGGTVHLDRASARLEIRDRSGRPWLATVAHRGFGHRGRSRRLELHYPAGEMTFGLGEKTGRLDKRGSVLRMWNTDTFLYDRLTDPIYASIPFWIGLREGRAHGVFLDNSWPLVLDLGVTESDVLAVTAAGGPLDLHAVPGPRPPDVLDRYTCLTGRPALPPLWALGFQQCRYSYEPDERLRELARSFRDRRIPCDVLYLDIHHMDGFRAFTWDPERFPDPATLLADLHAAGFHVVAIVDPGLKLETGYEPFESGVAGRHFIRAAEGSLQTGRVWPGVCAFPDFTAERTRAWWGELHRGLVAAGIDGFWNDMNEPSVFEGPGGTLPRDAVHPGDGEPLPHEAVHNVYGHLMVRATREGVQRLRPDRRPFVLTRAASAGIQRYAAGWSGDNASSFEDLRLSLTMTLNAVVSGQPFFGADVGGFGGSPTPELLTRWLELGAFLGLMRIHSCFGTPDQEPWSFGSPWEPSNREAIERRYRLLPYLYALFHEAHSGGTPPVRPLWYEWPGHTALARRDDVFLLGPSLLVAPVLQAGLSWRRVPLPPGRWFTFPEGRLLPPRREVSLPSPVGTIPVLARAGAIIPWVAPRPHVGAPLGRELTLKVFAGAEGAYAHWEDDGDGPEGAPLRRTRFRWRSEEDRHRLDIEPEVTTHPGHHDRYRFLVHGLDAPPATLRWDPPARGRPADSEPAREVEAGFAWDADRKILRLSRPVGDAACSLTFEAKPAPPPIPVAIVARPAANAAGLREPLLALTPDQHRVAVDWWEPKGLEAFLSLGWSPEALHLCCVVHDLEPAAPCDNRGDDGLSLVIAETGPGRRPDLCRLQVQAPWEGGRGLVFRDRRFERWDGSASSVQLAGGVIAYEVSLPARGFARLPLRAGAVFAFDWAVQHSDRERRRGVLEWVQGFSAPESPGGRLELAGH